LELFGCLDVVVVLVYFKLCMDCKDMMWCMVVVIVNLYMDVFGYCIGCYVMNNTCIGKVRLFLDFDVDLVFEVCWYFGVVVEINACFEWFDFLCELLC